MRLLLLVLVVSTAALADDVYTWTDADGVQHFTDDPSQIPRGAKKTKTRGAEISTLSVSGDKQSNVSIDLKDEEPPAEDPAAKEAEWRGKFQQARAKISELEKQIAADKEVVEPSGMKTSGKYICYSGNYNVITRKWGPDACGVMLPDAEFVQMMERLSKNRAELKLWQTRLKELEFAAANAGIPQAWRE